VQSTWSALRLDFGTQVSGDKNVTSASDDPSTIFSRFWILFPDLYIDSEIGEEGEIGVVG